MAFNTLSPELQNILLVNHSYITKWLVFLFIIFMSAFYVWGVWPNHKPTNYFTQAISRVFFYCLSVGYLLGSPLLLITMSPELSFLDWYGLPLKFYGVFTSIGMILIFIDIISLGLFYVLASAGLDLSNGRVKDIMNSFENNKHFLKMSTKKIKLETKFYGR
jgi:hypothetical protein